MSSGIGIGISSVFGGPRGLPSDFSYGQKQFCDDDKQIYTPTPKNPGGTWSISPALSGFNPNNGAFSPYAVTGTFVVSHTFNGKTSTQTIVLNDSDEISTFTYPNSAYPQSGVNPTPTITGTGPGINTGTFSATPEGLSFVDVSTGEIDLSESALNSYVITYTSGSEFCADTATFTLEVEDPYVGFKFRILVPAGADQILTLETVNGGSAAPNSVINWGDGTGVQSLTTTTASNEFGPGTYDIEINAFDSTTPVDNFSVTSGEVLVTEVIDWGGTPWFSLDSAFEDCVNLTTFGTGTFKGLTGVNLRSCFSGCTSLTSIDTRNWDISLGSSLVRFALGCVLVENIYLPKLTPRTGSWEEAFSEVGTSVTDGCIFHLKELNFTGGVLSSMASLFKASRINPLSNFTNWVFGTGLTGLSTLSSASGLFRSSVITGEDPVLDVSGWTDFNSPIGVTLFYEVNGGPNLTAANGIDIYEYTLNISNLNTSTLTTFSNAFANSTTHSTLGLKNIIGLNTLIASPLITTIASFIHYQRNLAIDPLDNLSDAFMNSLDLSSVGFGSAFRDLGSLLTSSYGAAPNLASLDISAVITLVNCFRNANFSTNLDFSSVIFGPNISLYYAFNNIVFSNTDSHLNFPGTMTISGATAMDNAFSAAIVRKISFSNNVDFSQCDDFSVAFSSVKGSEDADPATTDINLPTNMSFAGASLTSASTFVNMFFNVKGPGSTGTSATSWNALNPCQTNNLLRALENTLDTPGLDADIVLNNCKYSGPQALVSNDYSTLISNGWTFGTLASEAPYFTLSSYSLVTGTESTATINSSYTGGTFTSSNTAIATVDASTGTVTTGADSGTCQIKYTLADGVCYNEVNLAVTIPLIANNFSFNFDGTSQYMEVDGDPLKISGVQQNRFTISTWINFDGAGGQFQVIGGMRNTTRPFSYGIRLNGSTATGPWKPVFLLSSAADSASNYQLYANDNITPNEWTHVACVADGTASPNTSRMKLYINGQLQTDTVNWQDGNVQPSENPLMLGAYQLTAPVGSYFSGKTDEWALWNTPLTGPQILDIYNGRLGVQNETLDLSKYANLGGNLVYWNRMGD